MNDPRAVPPGALTVAAGQAACTALDIPANVAVAADLVRCAADQGADLLVLPELFLTGYELPAIVAAPETYTLGPADVRLETLATACAETRTAVVVGAPTRDPESEEMHISALVLGRDGRFAARYDKQHVDSAERSAGFSPGTSGCTLTVDGWRLGLGICWDSSYPEHARAAALDGCHAYLFGAMFGRGRGAHRRATLCPARALDNASYVVVANHNGPAARTTAVVAVPSGTRTAPCSSTPTLPTPAWLPPVSIRRSWRVPAPRIWYWSTPHSAPGFTHAKAAPSTETTEVGIDLGTSEDDVAGRALYESAGFTSREGGPAGPRMLYYERDLLGARATRQAWEAKRYEREHCGGALRRLHVEGAASAVTS